MRATKYIITSPESDIMPSDIAMKIYGSKYNVNVKETCFGIMIDGEEDIINDLVREIREMDPNGIFVKDRGFPPGDPRRCRGRRGGGPRPGFYMIEHESKMLPLISKALASEEKSTSEVIRAKKKPIDIERLESIIKTELS